MLKSLLVWLAEIFADNFKEIIREPKPAPFIEIEPSAFFQWAGNVLVRWELLAGARVEHTTFGKGKINKAHRAQDRTRKIQLSIYIDNDQQNSVFFASDFNSNEKPFCQLLVDANCYAEFQKGVQETRVTQADILEAKPILATQVTPDNWKQDWVDYEKILKQYEIQYLYHFTDAANLPSIIQHGGLYSWSDCQENGISILRPGGNELSRDLDQRRSLHEYVRLSLTQNSPMLKQILHEHRIENPVWLQISPDVIYWKDTRYSNRNATANDAEIGAGIEDFKKINFEIATSPYYNEETKSLYQAEILVKTHIPSQFILNLQQAQNGQASNLHSR